MIFSRPVDNSFDGNCQRHGDCLQQWHFDGFAALFLESNPAASPATVSSSIINSATPGVLSSIGVGSPNLLLYSLITPSGDNGGSGAISCAGTKFTGTLSGTGAVNYHSDISGFNGNNGLYVGTVNVSGGDVSFRLERKKGSHWSSVAGSNGTTSNESIISTATRQLIGGVFLR